MQMVTVSVIIPTCNRAHIISRAIRSVLSQSYFDFELIIVDDASQDGTEQVVKRFCDPRIAYSRNKVRLGAGASRNRGIRLAKGEYVAFLDDDDEWLPTKLSKQTSLLSKLPKSVAVVYTACSVLGENGKAFGVFSPRCEGYIFDELKERYCIGATSTVMLRKEVFDKVGGFDEELPYNEDWDMWLRIARYYEFRCILQPLVNYYVSTTSMSKNAAAKIRGIELFFSKHGQYFSSKKTRSSYYFLMGDALCLGGDVSAGRRYFLQAILCDMNNPNYMLHMALSVMGCTIFNKLHQILAGLNAPGIGTTRRILGIGYP